ncbi:hypothetical protein [uncultured Dysosmobacter sp.]|nr:hypothetical protein [uncultured Dysosmobacter sp.]
MERCVHISIDTAKLDIAIKKAEQLVEILREAQKLIRSAEGRSKA